MRPDFSVLLLTTLIGAGRATKDDTIDPAVGVILDVKIGAKVDGNTVLCRPYYRDDADVEKAAELGLLNATTPEAYGGLGLDRRFSLIVGEEVTRVSASGLIGFGVHDIVAGYLNNFGTEAQKQKWLPKIISCEHLWCQGYSEPNAGSDLAGLRTAWINRTGATYPEYFNAPTLEAKSLTHSAHLLDS